MSKKTLEECRTDTDFINYCKKQDGVDVYPGGRHVKIKTEHGTTFVSNHHHDLPTGTRYSLLKQLAAIGISCLVMALAIDLFIHIAL